MALVKMSIGGYQVQVNPESISYNRSIETNEDKTIGKNSPSPTFKGYGPEEISFKIIFDGTGVIAAPIGDVGDTGGGLLGKLKSGPKKVKGLAMQSVQGMKNSVLGGEKPDDVIKMLDEFEAVVFDYQGKEHGPPELELKWGSFHIEQCYVTKFDVTFTLFSPEGNPIRCEVDLNFKSVTSKVKRAKEANNSSPDLTHVKTTRMGDELYLMCQDVYKDAKYYLQVAERNNIINFRKLNVGEKLLFPPLDK